MRRLAAEDSDIDLINMDTIWTPEFAEAGWLRELKGAEKADALDDVLEGPADSVEWEGKTYGVPLNTNAQLLWYRKDLVKTPPETWDEMIAMAKKLPKAPEGSSRSRATATRATSCGSTTSSPRRAATIVDDEGKPTLDDAGQGRADHQGRRHLRRADPSLSTNQEDQARFAFEEGRGAFQLNWPYVYAAARADAETSPVTKKVFENMGWARWPGVEKGEPSRVSIGGANIGISVYGQNPSWRRRPRCCMTERKCQDEEAITEGLPPVMNAAYDDPKVRKVYPFADLLREQLKDSVPRPATPAYSDVTLAIQDDAAPAGERRSAVGDRHAA